MGVSLASRSKPSPLTRAGNPLQAIRLGQEAIAQQCVAIEAWAADLGKEKRTEDLKSPPEGLDKVITEQIGAEIEEAYRNISLKKERGEAVAIIKEKVKESLILAQGESQETTPGKYDATTVSMALKRVESRIMRNLVLREGYRADDRGIRDVRPIWSRASMLPRTHGASKFVISHHLHASPVAFGALIVFIVFIADTPLRANAELTSRRSVPKLRLCVVHPG